LKTMKKIDAERQLSPDKRSNYKEQ